MFKSMISKCKANTTNVVWLVALFAVAVVLLTYEHHVLWKIQEQSLWLDTPLFFKQLMVVPGGLLMYIGTFLMQLLYYPLLGVLVLCGLWWLMMWLMKRAFNVSEHWAPLLLVPVALLLIANTEMGYWIYTIKLRGWYFIPTVGVTMIAALLWAFRAVSASRLWRRVLIVVVAVVGYPLFGSYGLAAVVLMAIWSWRLDTDKWQSLVDTVIGALVVVAVPLLCYQYVYYQTNMVNLWWTALPIFKIVEENTEYYIPYALLGVCLLLLVIVKWTKEGQEVADGCCRCSAYCDGLWRVVWLDEGRELPPRGCHVSLCRAVQLGGRVKGSRQAAGCDDESSGADEKSGPVATGTSEY